MDLVLNEHLVFRDLKVKNQEEVLDCLSTKLLELGFVKNEYVEAIKQREKEYPTGLPSTDPVVAIPHANYEMVKQTTLAIATLREPVLFENMENHQEKLPVQIVIMMAIGEPHGQIEMLQKIVGIIQNQDLRKKMIKASNDKELLTLLEQAIA